MQLNRYDIRAFIRVCGCDVINKTPFESRCEGTYQHLPKSQVTLAQRHL